MPPENGRSHPTSLYLIRHGEPEAEFLDSYYGQDDVPLGERGREQSRAVAQRLCGVRFDAVYASDLARAGYLADLLAEPLGLPVRRLAVFRERCMGILQGKSLEALERDHADLYGRWRADRVRFRVPEAENFEDLAARILPAVHELLAAFAGRRIALVGHAGPMRVILGEALGMPLDNIFRLGVDHASIHVIEYFQDGAPRVSLLNGRRR